MLARLHWARSVRRPGALARARLFPAVPVGAGSWGGGAGHAPAPLSGGGRGDHPPCLGGRGPEPPWLAGRGGGGGGGRAAASLLPFWGAARGSLLWPPSCRRRTPSRCACSVEVAGPPRGGGMRGGLWTAPQGAPSDLNPPSALPEWAMVMGGVMGGAASILVWCAAMRRPQAWSARPSGALVWARPSAATPAGAGSGGRWACVVQVQPHGGGGASPRFRGGGGSLLWTSSWGGGAGGGGGGAAPPPPAPPPRRASACHPLSPAGPPGYSRAVRVAGRPRASGAARSAANGSVRRGGGGEGGGTPPPWFAPPSSPGRPPKGPLCVRRHRRSRFAVGRQRAGRERAGGSPGALAAAAVPPHPGCSGLFGGVAGPPSLRSASVRSWA